MTHESVPGRVLVVEDEPLLMEAIVAALRECEIEPYTATHGGMALDLLREHATIELVLTDIRMPYMDGIELRRRAQMELAPGRSLHWFALTASAVMTPEELPGFEQILYKPIRLGLLAKLLRRQLDMPLPKVG